MLSRFFAILLISSLLASVAEVHAISTAQSGDWSSTSTWVGGVVPDQSDPARILTGHTVIVDANVGAREDTLVCLSLSIDEGGRLIFDSTASRRFSTSHITQGAGCSVAGATHGGKFWMFENDTLWLKNGNLCSGGEQRQDWFVTGANAEVRIEGDDAANRAVCIGVFESQATGDDYPSWWGWSGVVAFNATIKWAKFYRFGELDDAVNHGFQWDKDFPNATIENVIFDSTSFKWTSTSATIRGCTTFCYNETAAPVSAWLLNSANGVRVVSCVFIMDHNNDDLGNMNGALDMAGAFDSFVDSCVFLAINVDKTGTPHGPGFAINMAAGTTTEITNCQIDSFMTPFIYSGWTTTTVARCTIQATGQIVFQHSGWTSGGDGNRIFGNYISGTYGSDAVNFIECYIGSGFDSLDLVIAFNTIVPFTGDTTMLFQNPMGANTSIRAGVELVGNIFAGSGTDVGVGDDINVRFKEYSSNAYNSLGIGAGSAIDSTTTPPGNANTNTTSYGFVDSANGNFSLFFDSPMIAYSPMLVSDSAWCDSIFSSPNYNIGAYQGTGQLRNDLPIGPETYIGPSVIGPETK